MNLQKFRRYAIYVTVVFFFIWLFNQEVQVIFAFLAGISPTVILVYLQKRQEEKEHQNWLLRNKEACLAEIADIFITPIYKKREGFSDKEIEKFIQSKLKNLQPALFIWGTASVLRAWNELKQVSAEKDLKNITRNGERFFRIIRKELKHDDSSLKPGEVWASLLKLEDKQEALDACKDEVYEWDMPDNLPANKDR